MFNARFPSASVHDCGRSDLRSAQQGAGGVGGGSLQSPSQPPNAVRHCALVCMRLGYCVKPSLTLLIL